MASRPPRGPEGSWSFPGAFSWLCARGSRIERCAGLLRRQIGGSQKGGFQKGGFGGCSPVPKHGTRVLSDVPRNQKETERRYIRMSPGTKSRNEGTFAKTALLRNRPSVSSPTDAYANFERDFLNGMLKSATSPPKPRGPRDRKNSFSLERMKKPFPTHEIFILA